MTQQEIHEIIEKQRTYFYSGATLEVSFRLQMLEALKNSILRHEQEIHQALYEDLGKSSSESYMCEVGMTLSEISYMQKHLPKLARTKKVPTPVAQFPSKSFQTPSPYGVVLIMSPWNYPFLLTLEPLVDAIAAGNTAILKPSAYSPATAQILQTIVQECFSEKYVTLITGGREENSFLLNEHFDYIFFTGSQHVGKEVMKAASAHLTPVTLELGGKSPCIVDATANIKLAAKRIVFGKYLNCGQTCVAPDYILCDPTIHDKLVKELQKQIKKQFTQYPLTNKNYGKIINEKHFQRILALMDSEKIIYGGHSDQSALKIEPTILDQVSWTDPVMQEEIFGPVLPILTYSSLEDAILKIQSRPHPLALYLFSSDKQTQQTFTSRCGFGGGCINDVIIHLATSNMGFGGFGESGMGSYHGKAGFDTFSHYKCMVNKKTWLDLPMRYQPYRKIFDKMVRRFLK